jgi:hypothetical protein
LKKQDVSSSLPSNSNQSSSNIQEWRPSSPSFRFKSGASPVQIPDPTLPQSPPGSPPNSPPMSPIPEESISSTSASFTKHAGRHRRERSPATLKGSAHRKIVTIPKTRKNVRFPDMAASENPDLPPEDDAPSSSSTSSLTNPRPVPVKKDEESSLTFETLDESALALHLAKNEAALRSLTTPKSILRYGVG